MINVTINNINLEFETSGDIFSPKAIDEGTLAMLSQVEFEQGDKVLDLGCGYGIVGILAAKIVGAQNVVMTDINKEAIGLSEKNAKLNEVEGVKIYRSNGFENIEEKDFTYILSNPPYHVDFSVPKSFIEKGFNRLSIGGSMYMVTKRKEWYKNKLISVFGGVKISEINGYYVFMAVKKDSHYANTKIKK